MQERAEIDLETYDATVLAQSFKRDVLRTFVGLNFPGYEYLTPNVTIHVDTDPDPGPLVKIAGDLVDIGAEVDIDALAEQAGIALIPNTNVDDDGNLIPRIARKTDIVDMLKAATAMDIPVDVQEAGNRMGLKVMTAEEVDKEGARRTRVVAAGKGSPIEPAGDDPNDLTEAPPAVVDADGIPVAPVGVDDTKPSEKPPGKKKPKPKPKKNGSE